MKRLAIAAVATALSLPLVAAAVAQQGAMVRGKVVDEEGNPLEGVRIEFAHLGGSGKSFSVKTDDEGSYIRVGMPAGPYKVTFSKDGYSPGEFDLSFDFGALTEIPRVTLNAVREQTVPVPEAEGEAEESPGMSLSDAFREAVAATKRGDLEEAKLLYEQIIEVVPDLPEAHYNLGTIYRQEQAWAEAEAAFRKAAELEPENPDAYTALAAVYEDSGRRDEVPELLSSVSERFADDARFQFNMAVMLMNAQHNAAALAAFEKAAALDPSRVESFYYLGTLAIGQGETEKAIGHLETYVAGTGQNERNLATAKRLLESLGASSP